MPYQSEVLCFLQSCLVSDTFQSVGHSPVIQILSMLSFKQWIMVSPALRACDSIWSGPTVLLLLLDVALIVSCKSWGFVSSNESHFFFHSVTSSGMETVDGRQVRAIAFLEIGCFSICQLVHIIG